MARDTTPTPLSEGVDYTLDCNAATAIGVSAGANGCDSVTQIEEAVEDAALLILDAEALIEEAYLTAYRYELAVADACKWWD